MAQQSDPPAGPDADPAPLIPPEDPAPGAENSADPYARESAIEQLTGPEDDDD